MKRTLFLLILCVPLCLPAIADEAPVGNRWETAIAQFETKDQESPPAPGGILFTGSSTIRLWDLEASFPGLPAINRGFGGSTFADLVLFADRIVIPYEPAKIVVYSGDNDIASGKSVQEAFGDFATFADRVSHALPEARVYVLAIKPSVARWDLYPEMEKVNSKIAAYCGAENLFTFVEVKDTLLDAQGKPRADLLLKDGLHLNEAGYAAWTALLKPYLVEK